MSDDLLRCACGRHDRSAAVHRATAVCPCRKRWEFEVVLSCGALDEPDIDIRPLVVKARRFAMDKLMEILGRHECGP